MPFVTRGIALALVVLVSACAGGEPRAEQSEAPNRDRLEAYLGRATQLTESQREAMRRHQPFEGMTVEEARLAMEPVDSFVVDGRVQQATFLGGDVLYRVEFAGDPERVVGWTSGPEVELRKPEEFRPNPPLRLPR